MSDFELQQQLRQIKQQHPTTSTESDLLFVDRFSGILDVLSVE